MITAELEFNYKLFQRIQEKYGKARPFEGDLTLAVYEKICWALSHKLFSGNGDDRCYPCYLRDDGCIYEKGSDDCDITSSGDYLVHSSLCISFLPEYLLAYMNESPYWEYQASEARISSYELKALGLSDDDICAGISDVVDAVPDFNVTLFTEDFFDYFFEYAAVELMDVKNCSPFDHFIFGDDEMASDCLCIKSELLPYYLKLDKDKVSQEHLKYMEMIEQGLSVLQSMFNTGGITIFEPGLEAAYFISFSQELYLSNTCGTLQLRKELCLAGQLIDGALLTLNEFYHFIPQDVIKEKVVN